MSNKLKKNKKAKNRTTSRPNTKKKKKLELGLKNTSMCEYMKWLTITIGVNLLFYILSTYITKGNSFKEQSENIFSSYKVFSATAIVFPVLEIFIYTKLFDKIISVLNLSRVISTSKIYVFLVAFSLLNGLGTGFLGSALYLVKNGLILAILIYYYYYKQKDFAFIASVNCISIIYSALLYTQPIYINVINTSLIIGLYVVLQTKEKIKKKRA